MGARTRRSGGADFRDVNLVDAVERAGGVGGKHTCQSRREPGANDDRQLAHARFGIEIEQRAGVAHVVGHRHHVYAVLEQSLGLPTVIAGGNGDDPDIRTVSPLIGRRSNDAIVGDGSDDLGDARRIASRDLHR